MKDLQFLAFDNAAPRAVIHLEDLSSCYYCILLASHMQRAFLKPQNSMGFVGGTPVASAPVIAYWPVQESFDCSILI